MQAGQKNKTTNVPELERSAFKIELTISGSCSYDEILLEAIDGAISSLGESVKEAIYFHFENLTGIKKQEIPQRIDDFQNALERIFGVGSRYLEILIIKNLHAKVNTLYDGNMSQTIVPELTFQGDLQMVKENFEELRKASGH